VLDSKGNVKRPGVAWTTTTVRRHLLSPFPAALLPPKTPVGKHYNATKVDMSKCQPGAWDPILTEDAVLSARAMLLDPSRLTHDGNTRAKHLLSGIGRCAVCGGPIRKANVKTTAPEPLRGYRCTKGCFVRAAAIIEAYVSEAVVSLLSAPDLLQWMPNDGTDVGALRARRAALVSTRAAWFERATAGTLLPHEWDALAAKHDAEISEVDAALGEALRADPLAEIVTSDDVRGMWERTTTARRRAILGALVHHVEVGRVGKGVRVLTLEAAESTVSMVWRRTEHRASLTRARSLSKGRPLVPADAREVIGAALSA
jgi:site-specific DNA recombinase